MRRASKQARQGVIGGVMELGWDGIGREGKHGIERRDGRPFMGILSFVLYCCVVVLSC